MIRKFNLNLLYNQNQILYKSRSAEIKEMKMIDFLKRKKEKERKIKRVGGADPFCLG